MFAMTPVFNFVCFLAIDTLSFTTGQKKWRYKFADTELLRQHMATLLATSYREKTKVSSGAYDKKDIVGHYSIFYSTFPVKKLFFLFDA